MVLRFPATLHTWAMVVACMLAKEMWLCRVQLSATTMLWQICQLLTKLKIAQQVLAVDFMLAVKPVSVFLKVLLEAMCLKKIFQINQIRLFMGQGYILLAKFLFLEESYKAMLLLLTMIQFIQPT